METNRASAPDPEPYDVAVIGAGMAGMATAARLQAQGLSTIVLEAHGRPGGCAGYFRQRGFSFDVGATTLVDFEPGGIGGELIDSIGMPAFERDLQPAYVAWLPDRAVTLYRDEQAWRAERRRTFGDEAELRSFWHRLDRLAEVFWRAARSGLKLPVQRPADLWRALRAIGVANLPLARYLDWSMGDCLRAHGLRGHRALVGLLSILIEDTVHASVDGAPLINAALGITLRHAGLARARGGMHGFWRAFTRHYRALGGTVRFASKVESIDGRKGRFTLHTRRGRIRAAQVVSALPAGSTLRIAPPEVARALAPHVERSSGATGGQPMGERVGGAVVLFLGVPENEVAGQTYTHHQILEDYARPLGDGNNMFISVSAEGDLESAPAGHRAVMISTHCRVADWDGLSDGDYAERKSSISARLMHAARRVYPSLGERAIVVEAGTPRTYERFTHRPRGAVGGFRLSLDNANQRAIPHDVGCAGFWLAGDTTWPGLGTVACVMGSRIVAERVMRAAERRHRPSRAAENARGMAFGGSIHAL